MTTVGFGSGSFSSKNPRSIRGKKRKQLRVRNSLLESLEARHLMAAGPQLIGVQPNEGSLIAIGATGANATVLNTSPREIVLRFDDTTALDANTLSGIQFKRSGGDGVLESAYLSTDLGTNSQVVLDFSASLPGQQGNGLELRFTQASRTTGPAGKPASWPLLRVEGNRINIEVNVLAESKTTAADLVRAMSEDVAVASKVLVKRLRGSESTVIADTVPVNQILTLQGANSARVSSNLNSGTTTLQVEFITTRPGTTARIEIVSRDYGGQGAPSVLVDGQNIRVEVNSNARFATTVQELLDAINNSNEARLVVQGRLISGASFVRIGGNFATPLQLNLLAGDDVTITPAYVGFGDSDREVVVRFAETLPDDSYLIDILGTGPFTLRNVNGLAFNNGVNQSIRFDLDLGTTVQSVVPQPVVRASNGSLSQLRNQIHVFFNDDDLDPIEAVKPIYYELVYTGNSANAAGVRPINPVSVSYDAALNRASLVFNRNIDALFVDANAVALPIAALRLRIGNEQNPAGTSVSVINQEGDTNPAGRDAGSRFDTAVDLGGSWLTGPGAKSAIINAKIENSTGSPFPLDFPGANDEQGNRNNRYQQHIVRASDASGIAVINYNFSTLLGNANQSVQLNAITETQKDMVRQIMSLYEKYLGVRFTESDSLGLTIAVGDMQAIDPVGALTTVEANRPGSLTYAAGRLLSNRSQEAVVIDIQDFNRADQNQFGTELFRSFMRGIGVLLGLGNADELPQFTVQSNLAISTGAEAVFPGNADIIHGQFILRPEGKDIDLYRFSVPSQGGKLDLQILAERQADSSLLDASLRLYRNEGTTTSPRWVEIAANEDYFSDDPRISISVDRGGDYIVGVSAKGNTGYDPNIEDSGLGGKSEGKYQLRIDYKPPTASTLVDVEGTPTALDGDGDGRPGGTFNYWFMPTRPDRAAPIVGQADMSAYTVWVDKTASASGNGTIAAPYNTIARALQDARDEAARDTSGSRAVSVRILGNTQNRAYEIGFNRFGNPLADGSTFDVPKNVTVMIDAGAIIKMGRSRISAGSSTVSVDRSGGSLQLLGTPGQNVIVTSINDPIGIGLNPDRTPPAPAAGDWGGIDFRNGIDGGDETRVDKERNGLFLNSIIHSQLRYGGGQVVVDGLSQVITPINLVDSRPSIYNNVITLSADAAISATPNSFKESDFADLRSQASGLFIPDFDRVGPDIHGNRIVNNSINGLFVRTRTGVADTLETITVSARFDDIDITHVFAENLIIDGQPGGGIVDVASPPATIVELVAVAGGSLAAGTYNYRLVYVDASGNESLASIPTKSLTVVGNSSIQLTNLPPVKSNLPYVARRLYRSEATGAGVYRLVSQLNSTTTSFLDNGTQTGVALDLAAPSSSAVTLSVVAGGTLAAGTYNYRIVFIDSSGKETAPSEPTTSLSVLGLSSIRLSNLPVPVQPSIYTGRRLYRSDASAGGRYSLVAQLDATSTTFLDNGSVTGAALVTNSKIRARLDGSLVIDPGVILKSSGARIEVREGGSLIAEGTSGLPIVMTSMSDRTYGAGGTADTASLRGVRNASVGDWGGVFVAHGSSASLDYNRLSYAGGTTRIEGGFASFNAIEVHQADFRLANSRIENNAAGVEASTIANRSGRGDNSAATIFVRGAQPVLVNNRINDNGAAAISIDVNSLGPDFVNDPGRQSGLLGRSLDHLENQGPLIDGNRLSRNLLNGMVVRGQTLTTQSVWDDTDIVHIVSNDIVSDNFHTYGGLRLRSAPTESLVVKFGGGPTTAGLTATGTPLDFSNRIGGSVQIVGQPNFPVILTALADDTVGAGFGIDGRAAFDTDNNGSGALSSSIVLPTITQINQGTRIDNNVDPNRPGFFSYFPRAGGGTNNGDTSRVTAQGRTQLFADAEALRAFSNYIDIGASGQAISLENTTITRQPTLESADLVASEGTFVGNNNAVVRWRVESRFDNGVSRLYNTLVLSSDEPLGAVNFINYLDEEFQAGNNSLLYVTGTPGQDDFRANSVNNAQRVGFSHGGVYQQGVNLQNATYTGWAANLAPSLQNSIVGAGTTYTLDGNINTNNLTPFADATLGQAYGVADVSTALSWRVDPNSTSARITSFLELIPTAIQRQASPGSWDGVSMQTYSNDRNVEVVSERESARATAPSANNSPSSSQYLGQIARLATSGDENARLGFEVQGVLTKPSDVDVYSFTANGRTEVWLDIDRTTSSLDTVVELVAADGTILALSDNSYLEETQPNTNRLFSTLPGTSVNPLRKSTITQVPTISVSRTIANPVGEARDDYSTNPKDAGLRVVLPGRENEATLYHVRVRSSNQFPGQPANTPALNDTASVGQGRSKGSYQLQVRLGETQELPGSAVSYADIRFAQNGLTLSGVPRHSPLVGEDAEIEARANNTLQTAQELGNILQTDRRTIAVAGNLDSATDIDWFTFTINYQSLLTPLAQYLSTIFDVDYADGIGRADMSMYLYEAVFDAQGNATDGRLVQFGENSNILDDRSTSAPGTGTSDLSRGSTGTLDPFIGSVELRAGRYFLALTNRTQVPTVLANRLNANQTIDAGVRVQPVNSGQYIVEDRIDGSLSANGLGPITPNFLPLQSRVEYVFADVPLYLSRTVGQNTGTQVFLVNSFTGELTNDVGTNTEDLRDIAIRPNGDIRSFRSTGSSVVDDAASAVYINVNAGTAQTTIQGGFGNDAYEVFATNATPPLDETRVAASGFDFEALTYMDLSGESGFVVANRQNNPGVVYSRNILYAFRPSDGQGLSNPAQDDSNRIIVPDTAPNPNDFLRGAGTEITERGRIFTVDPNETITGVAGISGVLFAVSDAGRLYRVSNAELRLNSFSPAGIGRQVTTATDLAGLRFTGLTAGPRNVANGDYSEVLFGTTDSGAIVAFNVRGELQPVFSNGRSTVQTGVQDLNGIAFSNLDYNLWQLTPRRGGDPGHGINAPSDLSGPAVAGGTSWYFGFDNSGRSNASFAPGMGPVDSPRSGGEPLLNTYNFPGGASGVIESQPFSLSGLAAQDLPTLYFNYFMDNDDGSSINGSMTDSFRVFGVGDNGVWIQLTTNNRDTAEGAVERTLNTPRNGSQAVWRQARVNLGSLAGNGNVRLRFEFSTAGSMGYGTFGGRGLELRTISGNELRDGQVFTMSAGFGNSARFEIDMGYSLVVPGGALLQNGSSVLVSGETFAFWNGTGVSPVGNVVRFTSADSAATVAQALFAAMRNVTFATPRPNFFLNANKITISGTASVSVPANSPFVLTGQTGIGDPANVRVAITPDMTADQVAVRVSEAMEQTFAGGLDAYTTYLARDRYVDLTGITVTNAGPFTVSQPRAEDIFSENSVGLPPAFRAQNNAFEGLYLDDFIIGLAERGESVTGVRPDTSFVTSGGAGSDILVGPYQLEIRGGTEYGTPSLGSGITLNLGFAPNAQQAVGQTLTFQSSSRIADGQRIVLSDGSSVVTLEFDDESIPAGSAARGVSTGSIAIPYNGRANESAKVIASRVRDLINSTAVQSLLNIAAISSDGSVSGQNSEIISLVGPVSVTLPASAGAVSTFNFEGDKNTKREQGQVIVENSRISRSAGFGIVLQADVPGPTSAASNPGAVRNTITLNDQRLIPGAVVMNNELVGNVAGGIDIRGRNTQASAAVSPVPFARIVNNTILGGTVASVNASAPTTFGSDFYSQGLLSFADAVSRYDATAGGGPVPLAGLQVAADALGAPNYSGIGEPTPGQGAVSLGRGGVLVVQFTNNILTGSGDARPDLAVYEVGNSELARVEVSADNINYTSVGNISFNSRYVDLDAFGFSPLSQLYFVRITDVSSDGALSGDSVGADIDAVGALSSRPGLIYTPLGTGINVQNSASPTLLNNIIANHSDGIVVDATSTSTVVGATLFQGNSRPVSGSAVPGQFPISVASTIPLFSDPLRGNLYPVAGALSIDSTMDSLVDRSALLAVKQPLGLLPSPIIAPSTDINGMLRVDDPNVQTPPGLGERIFKDRGAADRSDFNGPTAFAVNPYDNDTQGVDTNPAIGTVEVVNSNQFFFDVQIVDASQIGFQSEGSGIEQRSVTSSSIVLYKNAQILVEGQDYRFGYSATSNIVRLTPIAGVWENNSVYQIRFINTNESSIVVVEPKAIVDGTIYTIQDLTNKSTRFELDTGLRIRVPSSFDGFTNTAIDGTTFRVDNGLQRITFEFDNNQSVRPNNVAVAFSTQDPPSVLAEKVALAIRNTGLSVNLTATSIGGGELQILGDGIQFLPDNSLMVVSGQSGVTPGYGLQIPTANGLPVGIGDGQTFTIQRGNSTVVFELDSNGTVRPNSVAVPLSTVSVTALANSIVNAINGSILGITATAGPNGLISVGNQVDVRVQATNTVLQVVGIPGQSAAIPVRIDLSTVITSDQVATLLINTIAAQNIPGVSLTQLGATVLIEGARGVAGLGATAVSGIRDLAGNAMRATEDNGQTVIDIFLGEGFDYGDAADPRYASKKASDGPRHRVVNGVSLGPTVTADPDARLTDLDADDGVVVNTFVASFTGSISVDVRGASPAQNVYVNAWIDINANGTFESNERLGSGATGQEFDYFTDGVRQISLPSVPRDARTDVPVAVRVRLSQTRGLGPNGIAPDGTVPVGEVEDYYTTIRANPYTNPSNNFDVNGDTFVSPIDVLQLVNYINNDNTNGRLPFPTTLVTPPYLDVNNNGFIDPLDVRDVIDFINLRGGAPEGEGEGAGSFVASNDTWVPAASFAAPVVESNKASHATSSVPQQASIAGQIKSLDDYLAAIPSEIGPAMAVESLEWNAMTPMIEKDSENESDLSVALALDDLLADWS